MSKPRHADKDSAPTSSGPKQIHHLSNYIFLFLLAVFLIAVYTFLLQKSYSTSTLEANVDQNITVPMPSTNLFPTLLPGTTLRTSTRLMICPLSSIRHFKLL